MYLFNCGVYRPQLETALARLFVPVRTQPDNTIFLMLEPMEEDILQVVKYCTDLIDDKDLEKLDLIIKYMKRYALQRPALPLCVLSSRY